MALFLSLYLHLKIGIGLWLTLELRYRQQKRVILPDSYPRHDIVNHGRYLSGFIHACHTNQPLLAATMIKMLSQPYRTQLLPGFAAARQNAKEIGALACVSLAQGQHCLLFAMRNISLKNSELLATTLYSE